MPFTLSKSPTKTRPKTTIQPQTSITTNEIVHVSHSFASKHPEKMTAKPKPVAIGTKGTVGSLILQEMEYFGRLEQNGLSSSNKPPCRFPEFASTGNKFSRSKNESVIKIPGKKKKRGKSNRFISSMCSMVQVEESTKKSTLSGMAYTNLKADLKKLQP